MPAEDVSGVGEVTPGPEQPQEGSGNRRAAGIWALLAAVLLAAIVLLVLLTQCVPRVPDVVGLTEKQANAKLTVAGYELGTVSKVKRLEVRAGRVAEQAPPGGAVFGHGRSVDLVVAYGADMVEVPDVVGDDTPAAQLQIEGQQLTMAVSGQYSDTIAAGAILSQNPLAGTRVPVGTQVVVSVSLGIAPDSGSGAGSTSSGSTGASGGGGSTGSGSSTSASNCTASYPRASVWSSGGDIFIRLTPGGGTRRLTSGSPWDTNPILSPNAKYVVFMRAPSKGARSDGIGRVCLTDFSVTMLDLPLTSIASPSTVYYGKPMFAPSRTGTAPGSDWLVTPQYLTEDPSSFGGVGGRLLITNVPIDSTWVSWNVGFRPTGTLSLSRSSKPGFVKITGAGLPRNFNVYTGLYSR
jgi:uncharacterized membrane protein YgcG